jgi:CRISPR/Cas system-associated exonuclease Cas4 (RecB family)
MGDHVHGALKQFFSQANRDRSPQALEALLRRRWPLNRAGFGSREQEREYGLKALEMLRLFGETQDLSAQPIMLEAIHKAPLAPGIRLMGKVDRVDRLPDGSLHVIDYKTGRRPQEEDALPLLVYAFVLNRNLRVEVTQASYLYLEGSGRYDIEPTTEALARMEGQLTAVGEEIAAEQEFRARPNRFCSWCDFAEICEARLQEVWGPDPPEEPPE